LESINVIYNVKFRSGATRLSSTSQGRFAPYIWTGTTPEFDIYG